MYLIIFLTAVCCSMATEPVLFSKKRLLASVHKKTHQMPLLKSDALCVFTLSRTHGSFPEVLKEAKSVESSAVLNRKKRKEGNHIHKHQTLLPQECRACDFCPKTLNLANKHKQSPPVHTSLQ